MFNTRQETITNAANKFIEIYLADEEPITREDLINAFMDGAEWADKHPINRWISFKDLKPKEGKRILIALKVKCLGDISYETFVWHDNMLDDNFHTLIAWQHIFELPKEIKDEQ